MNITKNDTIQKLQWELVDAQDRIKELEKQRRINQSEALLNTSLHRENAELRKIVKKQRETLGMAANLGTAHSAHSNMALEQEVIKCARQTLAQVEAELEKMGGRE